MIQNVCDIENAVYICTRLSDENDKFNRAGSH